MKPENLRIALGYFNEDIHIPNNKNFIFTFGSRNREFKTSNSNCRKFSSRVDTIHLRLFLREVYRMHITINLKSDVARVAINNSPCSSQKGLPRMIGILLSSVISRITKSVKVVTFATTTCTSSQIPMGIAVDLSTIGKEFQLVLTISNQVYDIRRKT